MGMAIAEKILARQSGRDAVCAGDLVVTKVETCVLLDSHFLRHAGWRWPVRVYDPDKVVLVADHIVMATNPEEALGLSTMRQAARLYGIRRCHPMGADQGISHQVIADRGYALPGTVLADTDSHTIAAGAFNCVARGLGRLEMVQVLCTGETWFKVAPTVRYELTGRLAEGVTAKDVFLYMAGRWGAHENQSIEFGGPGQAALTMNARRTLSTMCAELSAEFATWEPDDRLVEYMKARTEREFLATWPDPDARYLDVRTVHLDEVVPYVSGADGVILNTQPLDQLQERVRLDQCVVGACSNGTIDDLTAVADVVRGRQVAPWVRFIVTPGSQEVYREAARLGLLATIARSGALITPAACGACCAQGFGALAPGEVCLTATTRNYKGRMGTPDAKIYMASPATVAASAVAGFITHPREFAPVKGVEA